MRRAPIAPVLVVAIAACGRVGFAPVAGDGGELTPPDAASAMDARDADAGAPVDAASPDAPPDAGACAEEPCRLVPRQCGCDAGAMCGWTTMGPRVCVPAGTRDVGQTCARDHECVPGAGCIFLGPGPGVCRRFCESFADCADAGKCVRISWTGPVGVCADACDPVGRTGCPSPTACGVGLAFVVPGGATASVTLCANPGPGGVDAPCAGPLDCAEGLACWGDVCKPLCYVGEPACPTCSSFSPPAVRGEVELGACVGAGA